MQEYHKIQTLFKRDLDAPGKPMLEGFWTTPELEYLAGLDWVFTEKVDGTNIRIGFEWIAGKVFFGGRTDNAQMPTKLLGYLQETFTFGKFFEAGLEHDITLYGEGYGPGIQSGGLYRKDQSFVLFDVNIGGWWLERRNVNDIASKLGVDSVPVIGHGTLHDAIVMVKNGLKSQWGDFEAEGIVARPAVPLFNRKGERIICKIKGRDFK